ncbi:MAG: hypothetical protein Q7S24_01235, partial [bacterium]|nr:hypothetical protein [bacterium]
WFSGVTIIFGWINGASIVAGFWLTGALFILLENIFIKKESDNLVINTHSILEVWEETPSAKIWIIVYLGLMVVANYYLQISHTEASVLTPWQVLDQKYIIYFFLATLVLGYLLFTKVKVKFMLFFLCAHSLLLHAYLPATHTLFYGADQWRHLASQNVLLAERNLTPIQLDTETTGVQFDLGRISYLQFYSASIIFARLMQVDLISFSKWFLPIIWSIILPLLLYEWGRTLGSDKKNALLLVWLGFLPYIWQVAGSFSLPVNFGFLVWFMAVLLWFRRKEEKIFPATLAMIIFGSLLFLGYIMYFLVFWLLVIIYFFAVETKKWKKPLRLFTNYFLIFCLGLIIPLTEIIFGYSRLPKVWAWFDSIKQFLGNFSSVYLATGPRSHDIINGNVIFNQLPSYTFVSNIFISNRWWLVVVAIIIFTTVIWVMIIRAKKNEISEIMIAGRLLVLLFIGYFLGRYILVGEGVLSRRLDIILAWGIITLFFVGIVELIKSNWWNKIYVRVLLIFVLAVSISASYTLGPDTKALSVDEYKAMQYVWSEESANKNHCVLADTYPLLSLEALSASRIIGGGFPIYVYFGQPERVELLNIANANGDWITKSKNLTSADHCWLITKKENIGMEPQKYFGHVGIFKF